MTGARLDTHCHLGATSTQRRRRGAHAHLALTEARCRLRAPSGGVPVGGGLDPRAEVGLDGRGCPFRGMIRAGHGGIKMTDPAPATQQIEISDETYDGLAEFAASRGIDVHGTQRYLIEAATSAAAEDGDEVDD